MEILEGKDAGKQGKVVQVIRQRNWVVLEGLNTVSLEKSSPSVPFSLRAAWGDRKLAKGQTVQLDLDFYMLTNSGHTPITLIF